MILFSASTIHFVTIFMMIKLNPAALFFTIDQVNSILPLPVYKKILARPGFFVMMNINFIYLPDFPGVPVVLVYLGSSVM